MLAKYFSDLAPWLIIEFVPKSDSQVERLLSTREDIFPNYSFEGFEAAVSQYFKTEKVEDIKDVDSGKTLKRVRNVDVPTVDELVKKNKHIDLVRMAKDYPSPIQFSETGTKKEIATAIIKRMILDAEI